MSISKLRGKSALGRTNCENTTTTTTTSHCTTLANNNSNNNNNNNPSNNKLTKSSYIPQTSLLKIEPFVPSLNARLRRPIHRSYSTLSSSYFKKLTNQQNHHRLNGPNNAEALKARGKEVTSFQRQRSKSSGSSSSLVNQTVAATVVTQQPNGVCRIVRSPKEQEKLPDRINYDRRGLGAIPIFENEPNLRLLSLQHNLINVFHIPQQGEQGADKHQQLEDEAGKLEKDTNTTTNNTISKAKLSNNPRNSISKRSSSPLVNVGPPTSNSTSNLNSIHPARFSPSQGSDGNKSNRLLIKNSIILNTSSNTINTMKKSKSFISNYSKHLSSLRKNLHSKCSIVRAMDNTNRQSPSSLDVSPCESPVDVLNVKNNQLLTLYGEIFQNLVFLDLYDNQIEKISNLDGLTNLTVLLLGKNRINDMSGLASLKNTLRVLDLHGNRITSIGNKINCLQELKSLNLAGNQIRNINQNDFMGLMNLRELNLKRNKIKRANGFNHLTSLERLWLCHNDLHKVEDMSSIAKAINLLEVTIENNPVSLAGDCVSFLVSYLPKLQMLSQMPITEQVRRAAMAWRRNKELSDSNYSTLSSDVFSSIRREEVISNARTNWELLRSQQTLHKNLTVVNPAPDLVPPSSETVSTPIVAEIQQEAVKLPPIQGQKQSPFGSNEPSEKTHSSASSLGPNVDSSSSYFSSDNEDRDMSTRPKGNRQRENAHEVSKEIQPTGNKETNEDDNKPAGHAGEEAVEETMESAMTLGADSSPTTVTAVIQNPPVTIVSQSTATTINNGSSAMNPEKSSSPSSSSLGTGRASAVAAVAAAAPTKSQHQQQQRNPTMSLAISGNNNPGITSNPNVTTKRYMHGSLMRSQTTKPTPSAAANAAAATTVVVAANRAPAQLSHHNSTANNGVATSGSGNGLGNGGSGGSSSNNNSNCNGTAGGVTSSCNNGGSNAAANKTSTTIAASNTAASTATTIGTTNTKQAVEREREQGGDYLIEICGRYLNVYGTGALRFIDKQWSAQKAGDVHTLNFSYINFNSITAVLGRVKARFPHAEHFVFRETNISCLGQLNAMAELQGITSLTIDSEGNPICGKDWRLYAIYRLSHWGLKTINGQEVSEDEMSTAQQVYVGLSDLVLWSMPDAMLQPLLGRLRLEENCSSSKLTPKEWLLKADNALKVVVGKEALQWKKTATGGGGGGSNGSSTVDFENNTTRERGRMHFSLMIENTCNAVEKLNLLEELWPSLLLDIVRNTLLDYSQLDVYLKNLMAEIMK